MRINCHVQNDTTTHDGREGIAVPTGMARALLLKQGPKGDGGTPEGGSVDCPVCIPAIEGDDYEANIRSVYGFDTT